MQPVGKRRIYVAQAPGQPLIAEITVNNFNPARDPLAPVTNTLAVGLLDIFPCHTTVYIGGWCYNGNIAVVDNSPTTAYHELAHSDIWAI